MCFKEVRCVSSVILRIFKQQWICILVAKIYYFEKLYEKFLNLTSKVLMEDDNVIKRKKKTKINLTKIQKLKRFSIKQRMEYDCFILMPNSV